MKYIKTFESKHEINDYFIWQSPNIPHEPITYIVVQLLQKFRNHMSGLIVAKIQILYVYNIKNDALYSETNKPYIKELDIIKKDIVYSSDNLQDCLDKLPLLSKLDKYNL